ncbi:MAG: SprB repeat-containing protein, partial [Lewinella sp.]|nr:SprB repeat-containing protein [Lewinella sp.]
GGASTAAIEVTTQTWASNETVTFTSVTIICYEAQPTASANPDPLCGSDPLNLNATVPDPSVVASSTWSGPGTIADPGSLNTTATNLNNGSSTYTIAVTDSQGCTVTDEVTVSVNNTPTATTPSGPIQVCYTLAPFSYTENVAAIENQIINGQSGVNVIWYLDAGLTNAIDLSDPADLQTLALAMPSTIYATVDNGTCESSSVAVSLQVSPNPNPPNGSLDGCADAGGQATFDPTDADGQFTGGNPNLTVSYHTTPGDAGTGNSPITNPLTISASQTIYVRVENAIGCYDTAELSLNLAPSPTADPASLTVCDEGAGTTFDLTSLNGTVLNGQSGTVTYYTDMAATNPIGDPANFTSAGGVTVYAVVDDGTCPSEPAPITLSTYPTFDASQVALDFSPSSVCSGGLVNVSISIPFDPVGQYTVDFIYGPVGNPNIPIVASMVQDGELILTLALNEDLEFQITAVEDANGCMTDLTPPTLFILNVSDGPAAIATTITNCPDDNTFDLTSVDNIVNDGSGLDVLWFSDAGATNPIGNPGNYNPGGGTTVFAVVDDGAGCSSDPVPVELLFATPPPVGLMTSTTSGCNPTDVQVTFSFPDGDFYNIDLSITDGSGTSVSTYNGLVNGSTLDFTITETTTWSFAEITTGAGCTFPLASPPTATVNISDGPTANNASLDECAPGGNVTFDLTSLDETVNGGTGLPVSWFADAAGTIPIADPANYVSSGGTVYATVTENGCESTNPATVTLTVGNGPATFPATLELCDAGSGQASFDLTTAESTVNGGTGLPVSWYTDINATNPVGDPTAFTAGNGTTVYATITQDGCTSEPQAVTLNVTAAPTATPASLSLCDDGGGQASFDLTSLEGTVSGATGLPVEWYLDAGLNNPVNNPGAFSSSSTTVFAILTDGNCTSDAVSITLDVLPLPAANTASLEGCDEGAGQATFDLTTLNSAVSGGSGSVSWYLTSAPGGPIGTPGAFLTGSTTVFAVVDDGQCTSAPAAVTLTVTNGVTSFPAAMETCGSGGQATFDLTTVESTVNGGTGLPVSWFESPNGAAINFPAAYTTISATVYAVVNNNGCFSAPTPVDLTVTPAPGIQSTLLSACSDDFGQGTYDLTSVENTVNLGTGLNVNWFADDAGLAPIGAPGSYTTAAGIVFAQVDDNGCTSAIVDVQLLVLNGPGLNLQILAPVSCAGDTDGALDLNVSGSPNFTFDWSDNTLDGTEDPVGIGAGAYSVTVTDGNGCTNEASINLTEPAMLSLSCSPTVAVSTPGGTDGAASINVGGGTAGYTVSWTGPVNGSQNLAVAGNATASNLAAGDYSVEVIDQNGCVSTCSFTIDEVQGCDLSIDLIGSNPSCFGEEDGSVILTINSSQAITSINWLSLPDGQLQHNNLGAGTYNVTVTDAAGCSEMASVTLADPPLFQIDCSDVQSPTTISGTNGALHLLLIGGSPDYAISWTGVSSGTATAASAGNFTIANLSTGNYSVSVTDGNGCTQTCNFFIPNINCNFSVELFATDASCNAGDDGAIDVVLIEGQSPYTFDWSANQYDGTGTSGDLSNLQAGTYALTVTDNGNCQATGMVTVGEPAPIEISCAVASAPSVPGAADGSVSVDILSGPGGPFTVSWNGPGGNDGSLSNQTGTVTINNLPAGTYDIQVTSQDNCSSSCEVTLSDPGCALSLSAMSQDPSCSDTQDGSITLTTSNGDGNYTFDWSDDTLDGQSAPTGLAAGNYSVTVTDGAACRDSLDLILTAPAMLDLMCSEVSPASGPGVADGEAGFVISGGTAPYELVLVGPTNFTLIVNTPGSANLPGLPPGTYNTTLTDDHGCTTTCVLILTDNTCTFNLAISSTMESCDGANNGSAIALPMGGTEPYIFNWSDGQMTVTAVDLAPGDYTLTVTDASDCVA